MMVGGEKDKDFVSVFRLQLAARGIYIINPWTPGILNEKVSFPLSIMTSALSFSYSLCHGHCEWFLSSSPHLLLEATSIPFPRALLCGT